MPPRAISVYPTATAGCAQPDRRALSSDTGTGVRGNADLLAARIATGVLTAIKRGKWYTEGLQFLSIVGVSLPSFVVGILLILVFSVSLGWFPAFGRGMSFSSVDGPPVF